MPPIIYNDGKAVDAFRKSPITLGTDLEVSLHRRANKYVADSGLRFWTTVKDGHIGTDGRTSFFQYLVELRPNPGMCGQDLLKELVTLVKGALTEFPALKTYRWKAGTGDFTTVPDTGEGGAYFLPKGGHIHFGNLKFDPQLVYAFDMLLAPLCLLLEDPLRAAMRRGRVYRYGGGTLYGQLGGYRHSQKYPTWEYRTLPNFCKDPLLTVAFFDIAKALAQDLLIAPRPTLVSMLEKKARRLAPDLVCFNFCLKDVFHARIDTIFEILGSLTLLQNQYGEELLHQFRTYFRSHQTWPIESDMLLDFDIWRPPPPKKGGEPPVVAETSLLLRAFEGILRAPVDENNTLYTFGTFAPQVAIIGVRPRFIVDIGADELRRGVIEAALPRPADIDPVPGPTIVPTAIAQLIRAFSEHEAVNAFKKLEKATPKPLGLTVPTYTARKQAVRALIETFNGDTVLRNLSN